MMLSPSSRRSGKNPFMAPPAPASMEERDWAALPGDILFAVFLKLGPCEIMEGADRVCSGWRRVAVGDPKLWRCVDMGKVGQSRRWPAMARVAVDRAAGQCEAFSGPCDADLLLYLVERAPSLKSLHISHDDESKIAIPLCGAPFFKDLSHDDGSKIALNVTLLKKLPLLEDVDIDITLQYFSNSASKEFFEATCEACPHLKNLRMSYNYTDDIRPFCAYYEYKVAILNEKAYVIPVMCELRSLELSSYNLTAEGLTTIIDNCPLLESLNVTGGVMINKMDQELRSKCVRVKNLSLPYEDYGSDYSYEGYGSDY